MSEIRYVSLDGISNFLQEISQSGWQVLAPKEKLSASKPVTVFAPWQKGDSINLQKAAVPPKSAVLPECEVLFEYRKKRSPKDLNQTELELADAVKSGNVVVFGARACDARGFELLDMPYTKGLFEDPYYKAKRDALIVITLTCDTGCETCFCHWVGGGPTSPAGSDILLTMINDGYILQAITEKGNKFLLNTSLENGKEKFSLAEEARKRAWETLEKAPPLKDAPKSLKQIFKNENFWKKWTDPCISCGACTYFCPACYCFNITDEGEAQFEKGGKRLRSWDNCMSSRYTREASGHNPRPAKHERMRNRVSHKFWTFFDNWGNFLCSGCGRCITNCPVHLDIRAITLAAIETAAKEQEK